MRGPKGIDRLTVLRELAGRSELRVGYLRCGIQGCLARIEHHQFDVLRELEVVPRNRQIFLVKAEDSAAPDDASCRQTLDVCPCP
jgi:hypothetical protein